MDPGTFVSALSCVAEYTVAPIVKQVKYVLDYKQNTTNLPKEVDKLMDLKHEVEGLVSSAQGNAEDIKPSVEAWMKEVDQIAEAASQMIQEEEEESKKRCFIGLCPNPASRHRSSRKAFKETEQVLQLQADGRELREGSVSFPVSAVQSFPVTATLGKDFLDFSSRSKTWEEIMKALKDPDANVTGVYGMGGLGKTTLVKQVAARAAQEKLFDEVVMPLVTQKNVLDAREFQEEMAKVLGMKLDDQWNQWNVSQRADRIFKRLTQKTGDEKIEKKTIVILDDLRAKLDLEQVGIPYGAGIKGCKVLFTSRFQYISYAAQNTITLGVLEEEEAWSLFQETAGDVLEDRAFFNIGKEVTKNCKGLPILIVTVAGALLRRSSLGAWKDALTNLQQEGSKEVQEFVDSAMEFISFNHLPDANKSLFLLCGLLGGGEISIFDQLLKLGIGWGLFKHSKTVEEARNNLETLIHDLKASFLLLDGQSADTVRMHDVVRDVAIKIASNEGHNMLLGSSEEWPEDDVLRRCTALTFPYGIVPPLPECLESQSLEFLLLYHNNSLLKIRDNLFETMPKLIVLDIRSIDLFPKLPSSLAFLENLHTLSLNLCKLRDISVTGALKNLKTLSLNNTDIKKLPVEIGNLSQLRVLDLNGCSELKVIPAGIIQRLSRLEELHMAKSFSQWEVEGLAPSERRNASLDELNYLTKLTTLRIHIPDANLLPKDFDFEKLERFTILIGDEEWEWGCHDEQSLYRFRGVKVKVNGSRNILLEPGVQEILKRTEILYLDGMKNIHELQCKNFQELKFVHIQHCAETCYVVNAMEQRTQERASLVVLESLFLDHLPWLQNLCRGVLMAESSFSKLKYVDVNDCNSLRSLFSFSMARGLPHLEEVKVARCEALEAIVEDSREDDKNGDTETNKLVFRQLRSLSLKRLPKLTSFCNNVTTHVVESNEIGSEESGAILATFLNEKVSFPKLEELTLKECHNMEYLFDQSIVTGFEQLNFMAIEDCRSLKAILAQVEGEETNATIKFPRLVNLFLDELPCLTRFCSGCSIVFPTLTQLYLSDCLQLRTFVWEDKTISSLFNEKVELPNLKTLLLRGMDNVETVWHNQLHEASFFKLEKVDIYKCPKLLKIFPSTMLTRIQSLETLLLDTNRLVGEVFENDERTNPNDTEGEETRIKFSQLKCVWLMGLSNLERFCSGSCVVFPALTELKICDCEHIETFVYPIRVSNSKRRGAEDMDSSYMQPLFNEKVEFPSLKELNLGNLDSIKIIWDNQIHEDSFTTLEDLTIQNCENLLRIFPLAMLGRIQSLKTLWIRDSSSVEEIFEAPTNTHQNEIIHVMVTLLYLENLPKLKCVWREDLVRILSFRNLHRVEVRHCQSLRYLFPASVAQQLYHLEELFVSDCGVETIVCPKQEEVNEEAAAFVFPKLVRLWLEGVPKLESFYPGRHTTQWPSLKELALAGMFPSGLVKFAEYGGDSLLIPILGKTESLQVRGCPGLASIVQGLVSFTFLTELHVHECDGLVLFPTAKSLVQLTTLKVTYCETVKEIVASESEEDEIVFSKLKTLELTKLPSLEHFYLANCILKFPLLEQVNVQWCNNMKAFSGGITITPMLKKFFLVLDHTSQTIFDMDFERDEWPEEDKDLNFIIKEAQRLTTGIVTEPEISTTIVKQDGRAETCEDAVKCSQEVPEMNDKAIKSSVEAESSEEAIQSQKNDEICEKIIEPTKEVHTYDKAMETNDNEVVDELRKEGEFCEEVVEPGEEIDTCKEVSKASNESETLPKNLMRPSLLKETQGSQAPPPDIVDVTCPSSQSPPSCHQENEFQGLQVAQHLVELLEKARDKHGDFHISPSIKLKRTRISAMETVGEVLHILQTQPPRSIDAEKIQFMEDAFHDVSIMSFPVEWLRPLIDKAKKCFLCLQRKAEIDEMEAQMQVLKREMEMKKALFDEEIGFGLDFDQPLLDI